MKTSNRFTSKILLASTLPSNGIGFSSILLFIVLFWPPILIADNQELEAPLIELQNVGLASVSIQGAKVAVSMMVSNPNEVDIVVEAISYSLKLNGTHIKQGAIKQDVSFPAQQKRNIHLKVNVAYDTELPRIIAALNNPESTIYEISGSVTLKGEDTPFPFSHKDKLMQPSNQVSVIEHTN